MRRTFAWALVVGMAGGMLAGCGVAPGQPSPAGWHTAQAMTSAQDLALVAFNRASDSLKAAQAAAAVNQRENVIKYLVDAKRHLEAGNITQAFPQRPEAVQQLMLAIDHAIERVQLLGMMAMPQTQDENALNTDVIMPVQKALNQAQNHLLQS